MTVVMVVLVMPSGSSSSGGGGDGARCWTGRGCGRRGRLVRRWLLVLRLRGRAAAGAVLLAALVWVCGGRLLAKGGDEGGEEIWAL